MGDTEREALEEAIADRINQSFWEMEGGEGSAPEPFSTGDLQLAYDLLAGPVGDLLAENERLRTVPEDVACDGRCLDGPAVGIQGEGIAVPDHRCSLHGLRHVQAERDQALADLAEVKESFGLLRDELAKTRGERDDLVTAAIRQKGRANKAIIDRDQALATLKAVREYADEREAYGRRGRTVHSVRIASDLRRILDAADGGDQG